MSGERGPDPALPAALASARHALSESPDGSFGFDERRALWRALDEAGTKVGEARLGRIVRRRIALACARSVLPTWYERFPDDGRPTEVLESVTETAVPAEAEVTNAARRFWAELDSLFDLGPPFAPLYAGYAAARAALTFVHDEPNVQPPSAGAVPDENDVYRWDTAHIASLAASGDEGDAARRRAFWEWYLDSVEHEAGPGATGA